MSNITIPNTLSDGNTILASEHNQNYTAITDVVNGNIDNDNIAAGAAIAASKLAIANILTTASTISIGVGTTGDANPRIALDSDGHLVLGSGSAAGDVRLIRESAGVAAIRNAANSAYEDLKVDALTAAGTITCATITPTNAVVETKGGTGQSTITTGDLLYGSASNTISKLAVGSTDQVLTVAGGVPTWADAAGGQLVPIGSPLASISTSTLYTQAHFLGYTPSDVCVVATCTTTDQGYPVGARITFVSPGLHNANSGQGVTISSDATNLYLRLTNGMPFVLNKSTGSAGALTGGSWSWQFAVRGSN